MEKEQEYLVKAKDFALVFTKGEKFLTTGFSDASYADCQKTCKSSKR